MRKGCALVRRLAPPYAAQNRLYLESQRLESGMQQHILLETVASSLGDDQFILDISYRHRYAVAEDDIDILERNRSHLRRHDQLQGADVWREGGSSVYAHAPQIAF